MTPAGWTAGPDALDLPYRFEQRFGRRMRVLHIGNIANYAFVNARMQRRAGIEADCIEPGFFHIMACPEWLEAPIEGDHGDDRTPKWSRVDLGGYKRPDWFVLGEEGLAFRYLAARQHGQAEEARKLQRQIAFHARSYAQDMPLPAGVMKALLTSRNPMAMRLRHYVKRLLRGPGKAPPAAAEAEAMPAAGSFAIEPPPAVLPFIQRSALWRDTLAWYDVIQGYTIQSVYPAAAGLPNFLSYELGTIRGLPFEESPEGRLTRWVYRMSPEVFVTNSDCMPAAEALGLDMGHVHKVLHAFDIDDAIAFAAAWNEPEPGGPPVFYAPARQHWKNGNASILKGNDVAIRGAALLKARGHDFRLVLGEWGEEIGLSRELIAELGIADRIDWAKPLPRHKLWPAYMRARAIIDQFRSPAFGGVSLEALALGKRLITGYDHGLGGAFFSAPPPIHNCRTAEQVADAMEACLRDPTDESGLGRAAQDWMRREHSVARQLREQFSAYEALLSRLCYQDGRWQAG